MPMIPVKNAGAIGVITDISQHELPLGAWTDASNIRFLNGSAAQVLGYGEVYNSPPVVPQYVVPVTATGVRSWIYASAAKTYVVSNAGGVTTHTDITHATPRAGVINQWTGAVFGGVPVLNAGDTVSVPMYWDQNLAHKFADLPAWPAATYCKALRSYKNFLIALGITKASGSYPYMVKWSSLAQPGSLPASWDIADATKEAGEQDLAEGQDPIIDGLQLRDSFMIYKEASIWRMDFVGGPFVFQFSKVLGTSGAMNRNCIVEIDGAHVVLTGSDVIRHDGQSAQSILDMQSRRFLFQNIDVAAKGQAFVAKNPFLNEVLICYPSIGATACDSALVWNYKDNTVSFRSMPNVNHASFGPVDNSLGGNWNQDGDTWASDLTAWNGPDFTPDTARVILASGDQKLYLLDASASFNGAAPKSFLERRGLGFDDDAHMKLVKSIRPRIVGSTGDTVTVKIGAAADAFADPVYSASMTHTIGSTVSNDCMVEGRYIAIRFESGTAAQWRLDSFDIEVEQGGLW